MTVEDMATFYRDYISCLNAQDWAKLGDFVHAKARHNGFDVGLAGYREMLERDYAEIPDLQFQIQLLVCEPPHIASRLWFECTPVGTFLGLPVNGRVVSFAENVFYELEDGRIRNVCSIIDRAAIAAQVEL